WKFVHAGSATSSYIAALRPETMCRTNMIRATIRTKWMSPVVTWKAMNPRNHKTSSTIASSKSISVSLVFELPDSCKIPSLAGLLAFQETLQRATLAPWSTAAEFIAGLYDQRVEFVVVLGKVA